MIEDLLTEAMEKMAKAAAHVQDEFLAIRTGRANPALIERIRVEYYGTETPLQQLASFSVRASGTLNEANCCNGVSVP